VWPHSAFSEFSSARPFWRLATVCSSIGSSPLHNHLIDPLPPRCESALPIGRSRHDAAGDRDFRAAVALCEKLAPHPQRAQKPCRADRSEETRAGEELPRLPVKIGNPEAEIAARKLFDEFGIGCAVDRRHGFGIEDEV